MRKLLFGLAILAALLAIAPLIGLLIILINPPADPFGMPAEPWLSILQKRNVLSLLGNSLLLSLCVAVLSVLMGGWLAWTEQRTQYRGKNSLHLLGLLPLGIPSYILAATLAEPIGYQQFGFVLAVLTLSIVSTPYCQLTIGAALRRLSAAEEEAARLFGSGSWAVFQASIWPRIRPAVAYSMLISFLYTISDFGAVATLNVPVLTWQLYEATNTQDLATAAMLGGFLLLATLPILWLAQRVSGKQSLTTVANPRPPATVSMGGFALLLTYALHAIMIGLGLLFPLLILGEWVYDGWLQSQHFRSPWRPMLDSLGLALLASIFTLLLAAAPAWLANRGKGSPFFTQTTYLASALPGVLLAFGLMRLALFICQYVGNYAAVLASGLLLFIGYAMRFLAEAFGPLGAGIRQLDERHRHSALVLGASNSRWFFGIAAPQLRPNIAVAFLIVFLAVLKELPVTLMLGGSTGMKSFAFRIWDSYEEALWHDAGLSSLLLVALTLTMTILTLRWRRYV